MHQIPPPPPTFLCIFCYFSYNKRVNDDSQRPNVNLIRMSDLSVKNLRRNVVRCSTNCVFLLSIEFQFSCKTKITKFDFHFFVEEEIAKFKISVDHFVTVQVFECDNDLNDVALHFEFRETLSALDEFIESIVRAQFEQNVNVFVIFKNVLESNNVLMIQTLVDLDFRYQFLSRAVLGERLLRNDFRSDDSLSF